MDIKGFKKNTGKNKAKEKAPKINVHKGVATKKIVSQILNLLGLAIVALFLLYVVFAVMIIRVVPAGSGVGAVIVKNNTFYGGVLPENSVVLVDNANEVDNSPINNLKMSLPFINNDVSMVQVKAGPTGKWSWISPGIVTIDGRIITDGFFPPLEDKSQYTRKFLSGEYLGLCIKGNCEPGTLVLFNKNNVMGVVVSKNDAVDAVNNNDNGFFPEGLQSGLSQNLGTDSDTQDVIPTEGNTDGENGNINEVAPTLSKDCTEIKEIIGTGNNENANPATYLSEMNKNADKLNVLKITEPDISDKFNDFRFDYNSYVNFLNKNDYTQNSAAFEKLQPSEQKLYYEQWNELAAKVQESQNSLLSVCNIK